MLVKKNLAIIVLILSTFFFAAANEEKYKFNKALQLQLGGLKEISLKQKATLSGQSDEIEKLKENIKAEQLREAAILQKIFDMENRKDLL